MVHKSPVLGLLGYCCEDMCRDVGVDIPESSRFVHLVFLCCKRRWNFMVAMDFGRCFVIHDSVRQVQYAKWLLLITWINIDFIGLKADPCRKAAKSALVFWEEREVWSRCSREVDEVDVLYAIGILQRTLVRFMRPKITSLPYLMVLCGIWWIWKYNNCHRVFNLRWVNRWKGCLECDIIGQLQIVLGHVGHANSELLAFCCCLLILWRRHL